MKPKFILILLLLFLCFSCKKEKPVIYLGDPDLLSKRKALKKYGKPYKREVFPTIMAQSVFRNYIEVRYSNIGKLDSITMIDEITWRKNKDTLVTVWYEQKDSSSVLVNGKTWKDPKYKILDY